MKPNQNIFYISLRDKYFLKIFFITLIFISILIILFGPRNHGYMKVLYEYNGFRPIGYPLILQSLSLFFQYETIRYLAIFINGIFFSFIFSSICTISKNCYSNSYLCILIFFFLLCPLFYEVFTIRETLMYSFFTFLIVINYNTWEDKSFYYGLLLGFLFIIRPTGIIGILSFLFISSFVLILKKERKEMLKKILNTFFWFFIIFGISVGIIYFNFGILITSSSCTGSLNIFKGLVSIDSMAYIFADLDGIDKYLKYSRSSICNDINYFKNLSSSIFTNISTFEFIKSFFIKFILFFFSYLPLGTADLTLLNYQTIQVSNFEYSVFRILVSVVGMSLSLLVIIIFVIRIFRNLVNQFDYFLFFYCVGHAIIYSITWPEARFKFPIDPILIIYLLSSLENKKFNSKNILNLTNKYFKSFLFNKY